HILPIFRMKDGGYSKLKNNFSTLNKCFDAIKEGKTILIMAEGGCKQEKRLRPLRKGTARLAFGALDLHPDLDIQIVPVGVNYTYPDEFRSEIMLDFGHPIAVQHYVPQYQVHPQEAIKSITKELDKRLRKRIVIINEEKDEGFVEALLQQYRNEHPSRILPMVDRKDDQRLATEIAIANSVNVLPESRKEIIRSQLANYESQLQAKKVNDWGVVNAKFPFWPGVLILILGLLPFILGYFGNYIPVKYAEYFKKQKVKEVEDAMSVGISVGIVAMLIYYLLLFIICLSIGATKWIWFVILLPIWGYFSLVYKEFYQKWISAYRFNSLAQTAQLELAGMRQRIKDNF
ncbi:MAG: 1-acyl-sn-glycerol-3-phosphate acyltransferase, partial [Saprospiraceae bacterium]